MRVTLPPLDEQRQIVAILNRAAKIERLRAQAAERPVSLGTLRLIDLGQVTFRRKPPVSSELQ